MGLTCSTVADLSNNENLKLLSGKETISENDPFWNQLLSFSLQAPQSRVEQSKLEEITDCHCKSLVENNQHTGNFTSLLKVFLSRSKEIKSSVECGDKMFVWQCCNALYIIRHLCKFLAENMSEENMLEQFEARSLADRQRDLETGAVLSSTGLVNYLDQFVETLQDIAIEVPVLDFTYNLHMEAVTSFLVLLSVQMFLPSPTLHGPFTRRIMTCTRTDHNNKFVKVLLQHYIEQKMPPNGATESHGGSVVLGLASAVASGVWSIVNRGREQSAATSVSQNSAIPLLGHRSSLLLLALISYTDGSIKNQSGSSELRNFYHDALQGFRHIQGSSTVNPSSPAFHLNLSRLFQSMCNTQYQEASTLLLYFLIHKNPEVRAYILSKTDIDKFVVPILKILYSAPEQNSHHIYMALIILLILTEDDHFNQLVHEIQVKTVEWYKDRMLRNVTLGDLIILVVVRTIQYNMTRMRDRYLHTNCLAALANMSAYFRNLHSYACQRIFSLLTLLVKKRRKVTEKLANHHVGVVGASGTNPHGSVALEMESHQDYASELSVLIEVLRMLLEILNSCLTGSGMRQNVNLIYALLREKEVFDDFRNHPGFQDILQNIDTIVAFFGARLTETNESQTMEEVHEEIKKAMLQVPSHQLKKFPDLKFRYVEEESPEEFFVPYVWSLAFNRSNVFWNPGCVQLFALDG